MGGGPGPLAGCGDSLCGGEGEKRKGGTWGTVYVAVAPTAVWSSGGVGVVTVHVEGKGSSGMCRITAGGRVCAVVMILLGSLSICIFLDFLMDDC